MDPISLTNALNAFSKYIQRAQYKPVLVDIDIETGLTILQHIGRDFKADFVIDKENRQAYEQLFWYFTGQFDHFNGDPYKGILAIGKKGSGKTLAMYVMQHLLIFLDKSGQLNTPEFKPYFKIQKCTEIKSDFADQENGGLKVLKPYKTKHDVFCFDDIGEEIRDQALAIHYGIQLNVMENILTTRAEMFKIHHTVTHATSNYPIQSTDGVNRYWEKFYGDRIADRAREMFNVIPFMGESRRK
jgi:DNA replication protein DnaC